MKLYFHFHLGKERQNQIVTAVTELTGDDGKIDLNSCLDSICAMLKERGKIILDVKHLQVSTSSRKKALSLDTAVMALDSGTDLKVTLKEGSCIATTKYEKTVINKSRNVSAPQAVNSSVSSSQADPVVLKLLQKANQALSKKLHDQALLNYKDVLLKSSDNYEAIFGMAYIYFKAGRFAASLPYFEKLVSKDSGGHVVLLDYGRALIECSEESKAVSVISRCINDLKRASRDTKAIHDANVTLADALESMGQLQSSFQLYLSVSQMTEKQHVDALLGYARVGYKLGHVSLDDVFIVVLNAVALRKNNTKIQSFFSKMVQEKGGFASLQKQMHEAWTDAPAVVYIATFLRECGALDQCLRLLKHAHKLAPKSVDIALLFVHVLENACDLKSALSFVADFLDSKHDRQVLRKVDLSKVVTLINMYLKGQTEEMEALVNEELNLSSQNPKEPSPTGNMANLELQLLAIYFTVVKIFYIKGDLKLTSLLVKLLRPLFTMNQDLHKTLIRNEQAFFSCISQLSDSLPPAVNVGQQRRLFVVGDSHVLPLAWRSMKIKDVDYVTFPIMLTGLKIWHLRKDSTFYTKRACEKAVQQVPNGASCVFVLGEIDCREGIQRAVEKCAYDCVEDCITSLVEIYVKTLLDLHRVKKLKIIIHPVPSVLKETHKTVRQFNEGLKERVMKTPKLLWLDFANELIDVNTGYLKEEYVFDGAHLHPKYCEVVAKSLQKHF